MTHIHKIVDTGKHFTIDPVLRVIHSNISELVLVQGDHNSERYTFEVPRTVEGHDMSLCNRIEIHYDNIAKNKRDVSEGFYLANDTAIVDDAVRFSWLISGNATRLAGSLQFWINFICVDEDGNIVYSWGTNVFKGVKVNANNNNTSDIVAKFPDVLEQWKKDILSEIEYVGDKHISYLKSPDEDGATLCLRNLNSGVYIFNGTFKPYLDATSTIEFTSDMLANIISEDDVSHVQILYAKDNTIQYLEVYDDSVFCQDNKLIDMQSVVNMTTVINDESDDEHYPTAKAVKALFDSIDINIEDKISDKIDESLGVIENGSY